MALTVALAFSQDALYGLVFLSYMNHYLLDVLNTSPALPGYTLALYGGVKLAIHPAAGRLLDRHSPRSLFRAAVAVQGAGLVLVLLVHTLWSFLAATCLIAVGSAAIWPLLYETIARTQLTQVHSRVTGIITFAGDIATGVGLAIGVVAGNFGPWRSAFYIALAIAVLPILGQQMSALDRSPPDHSIAPPPVALPDGHGGVRVPHLAVAGFKDRIHGAAYFALVVFIDYAAVSSLGGVYGAYVRRSLDITLLRTAILLIPAAAAAGLALLLASRFSRPERRMLELAVLFVISAAGALGLAAAPTPYVAAGRRGLPRSGRRWRRADHRGGHDRAERRPVGPRAGDRHPHVD